MSDYIDFGNNHITVVGMTQSGKTTAVTKSIEQVKEGVLFFNTQEIEFSSKYVEVTGADDMDMIVKALRKGEKLNFIPNPETRWKQLVIIIKRLFLASRASLLNIYIVVDEVHLSSKEGLAACIELATTGIRWGLRAIYISQRPALVDNTLMNQSMKFVFLKTTLEKKYLESYGLPYEEIKDKLISGGQYAYVVYDFETVQGAFKV